MRRGVRVAVRLAALLGLGLAAGAPAAAQEREQGCGVCHGEQRGDLLRGVHAAAGVTCTTCHGGRAEPLEKDAAHGDDLRALGEPLAAVELCGGCHADVERMRRFGLRTDPLGLYWTSLHGQRLREDGAADVATCVSCHGGHAVFRAEDPRSPVHERNQVETCGRCHGDPERMAPYGLDADPPALYRESVHGRGLLEGGRLSNPTCSDCHGSHGATPPSVEEVGQVCGHCHGVVQAEFERGPHLAAVREGSLEECISCHGHHAVQRPGSGLFLGEGAGHCGTCHQGEHDIGLVVAQEMYGMLGGLEETIAETEASLREAAARGLFLEKEHGYLDEARALRSRAGSLTHALSLAALTDLQARCLAMVAQTRESLAVKQRALRDRKIFTGILFVVVLMFVGVILIYRLEVYGPRDGGAQRGRGGAAGGPA